MPSSAWTSEQCRGLARHALMLPRQKRRNRTREDKEVEVCEEGKRWDVMMLRWAPRCLIMKNVLLKLNEGCRTVSFRSLQQESAQQNECLQRLERSSQDWVLDFQTKGVALHRRHGAR